MLGRVRRRWTNITPTLVSCSLSNIHHVFLQLDYVRYLADYCPEYFPVKHTYKNDENFTVHLGHKDVIF